MKPTGYRIGETVHLASLGIWTGALVGAGIAAAVTFPTVRDVDPNLPAYAEYAGPHWMLAAGKVASKVFLLTDFVQFGCAFLAIAGFALAMVSGKPPRSWLLFARALFMGLAFLAVAYHLLILMPGMQHDLRQYWDAALQGDTETAERFRQAFADRHPAASRSIGMTAIATLLTLATGLWHVSGSGPAHKVTHE